MIEIHIHNFVCSPYKIKSHFSVHVPMSPNIMSTKCHPPLDQGSMQFVTSQRAETPPNNYWIMTLKDTVLKGPSIILQWLILDGTHYFYLNLPHFAVLMIYASECFQIHLSTFKLDETLLQFGLPSRAGKITTFGQYSFETEGKAPC